MTPEEIAQLFKGSPLEAAAGAKGIGGLGSGILSSLTKSEVVKAILVWDLMATLLGPLLIPLTTELQQEAFGKFPTKALDAEQLANAVVRGHMLGSEALKEARKSGYDAEPFNLLLQITGEAPGLQELMEMWRRGLIPEVGQNAGMPSVDQGIREGRLNNKWVEPLLGLRDVPLSPAAVADMVVRSVLDWDKAAAEAWLSGVNHTRFDQLVANAGEPIALGEALLAWRRGFIPENGSGPEAVSLDQVIRESRLKNKYLPVVKALQWVPLSAHEWVAAWLRGQVPEAEAVAGAAVAGTTEADARILYNSSGRPPSPSELMVLLHRKLIPLDGTGPDVKSFQQGIYEGDTKDKWWTEFAALATHLPPPRSIVAMVRSGAMPDATAKDLLEKNGLPPELAAMYLADAHHSKTQTARELTTAQVLTAYSDRLITAEQATAMLTKLRWTPENAKLMLAERDMTAGRAQLNSAISKTRTLFLSHKITEKEARASLGKYGVPAAAQDQYVTVWVLERRDSHKVLTQAEIAWAFGNDYLEEADALAELEQQGYSPRDAWIVLAHHSKKIMASKLPSEISPGDELGAAR